MLFDEVTSALELELVGEVLEVIEDIARTTNMTMILITHAMDFACEISDRVVFIDKVKIVEQGLPEQIVENPKTKRLNTFLKRFRTDFK